MGINQGDCTSRLSDGSTALAKRSCRAVRQPAALLVALGYLFEGVTEEVFYAITRGPKSWWKSQRQ